MPDQNRPKEVPAFVRHIIWLWRVFALGVFVSMLGNWTDLPVLILVGILVAVPALLIAFGLMVWNRLIKRGKGRANE